MADFSSASRPGVLEMETKSSKSRFTPRTHIICVSINLLISVVILIMAIVLFTVKKETVQSEEIKTQMLSGEKAVLEKFPGYFRTAKNQSEIEERLNIMTPADIGNITQGKTCNVRCPNDTVPSGSSLDDLVYHGCCSSRPKFISPTEMKDFWGIERVLAQFDGYRQYFRTEECTQGSVCNGCTCQLQQGYSTGVYVTCQPGNCPEYHVGWFEFNVCCKCVNNLV